MAKKRITDLTAKASPVGTDVLHIASSGADNKITYTNLKKAILDNKQIGVLIVTTTANQLLSNKLINNSYISSTDIYSCLLLTPTINSPYINSIDTQVNVDSSDINRVCGTVASKALLDRVSGVTSNIQTQLNAKMPRVLNNSNVQYCYSFLITLNRELSIEYLFSDILRAMGLSPNNRRIPLVGLSWFVMKRIDPLTFSRSQLLDLLLFDVYTGQKVLRKIIFRNLDVDSANYIFTINFKTIAYSGEV